MMRKCVPLLLLLWTVEMQMAVSGRQGSEILRYNRDDLLLLRNMDYPAPNLDNCGELILKQRGPGCDHRQKAPKRKRGRRGGVRLKLKGHTGTKKCPPLPFITLANVRYLRNKLDELQANISCQWAYKETTLICLMETWLDNTIADSELSLDGFGSPLRLDRDTVSGLKGHRVGCVCILIRTGAELLMSKTPAVHLI